MKKIIVLLLFTLFGHILLAQSTTELNILKSDRFTEDNKANAIHVVCKMDNGNLFTLRFGKKYGIAHVLNSTLEIQVENVIRKNKYEVYKGHIQTGNTIKVFTVDASEKRERIINCYTFDATSGEHQKKQLVRLPIQKGKELFPTHKKLQTSFAISPNKKYITITMGSARKKNFTYYVYVFNSENLKTISKQKIQEKDTYAFQPKGIHIDNEANIFLLKKVWIETDEYAFDAEDEIENYEFQLHKLSQGNKTSLKIKADEKFVKSLRMRAVHNDIQLLGYYADKGYDRLEGTCTFQIQKEDITVVNSTFNLFSKQLFYEIFGANDRPWLLGFSLDYILEDKQGNAYMLAENAKETYELTQNPVLGNQAMTSDTKALKGDILVLKIDSSGMLVWGKGLHRTSKYADYNAFVKDEKLHVLFNSGEKTLEKMKKRAVFKDESLHFSALYDIVYAADGNVSFRKVQHNEENRFYAPIIGTYANGIFLMVSEDRFDRKYMQLN